MLILDCSCSNTQSHFRQSILGIQLRLDLKWLLKTLQLGFCLRKKLTFQLDPSWSFIIILLYCATTSSRIYLLQCGHGTVNQKMTLLYSSIGIMYLVQIFFFISLFLEIVPTIHQDLATRSQSSDALTLYHHQPQAMVNDMSIGEGSLEIQFLESYFSLENYSTSEEAVSHNVLYYQQLSITCYQVSFYAKSCVK